MPDYMTIQGKQVPYTRQAIAISECELDPANPRIQYLVMGRRLVSFRKTS